MADRPGSLTSIGRLVAIALLMTPLAITGCEEELDENVTKVKMRGESFYLEIAADDKTIADGLMWREEIAKDGGMIFVFPNRKVKIQRFWMKNCIVDMDIIFLDGTGRVLNSATMTTVPLKGKLDGAPDETDAEYERRIRETAMYPSRGRCQFVIEVKAGTAKRLGLEPDDKVEFDIDGLKARLR